MQAMVSVWWSDDNLQEWVFPFTTWGLETELRLSGLVVGAFTQ